MKRKLELFQCVVLERDIEASPKVGLIEQDRLAKGAHGAIVDFLQRDGVAVEFFDDDGNTIDVAFIPKSYIRPATDAEIEAIRNGIPLDAAARP